MYVNRRNIAYICLPSSRFSHPLQVFVCELERLTVLPAERWAGLLADAEADVARRAVSLQAEATRLADNKTLTGVCESYQRPLKPQPAHPWCAFNSHIVLSAGGPCLVAAECSMRAQICHWCIQLRPLAACCCVQSQAQHSLQLRVGHSEVLPYTSPTGAGGTACLQRLSAKRCWPVGTVPFSPPQRTS